jgi:putative membrane protein
MWYMHDIGWGWWLLMSVGMVAFWGLVVYGVLSVARGEALGRSREPRSESADEVLRRRLAAGEITVEEYQRVRSVLEDSPEMRQAASR